MHSKSTLTIDLLGNKFWKNKNGEYHRLNGPAIELNDGTKSWWQAGLRQRSDGPAVEYANGDRFWFRRGKKHRLDGPAVEYASGEKHWYNNDARHRLDGPAIIMADGTTTWWIHNTLYKTKQDYFDALTNRYKTKCLFSRDFLNG
jgi:hypothetical protein